MYDKIKSYLTSLCILALSIFSLFSALAIRQLNDNYENMCRTIAVIQSDIEDLRQQISEIDVQETVFEQEIETEISFDWDYEYVLRVVAAECRGEPFEGKMAVAQVIQERATARDMTPEEVVKEKNQFASPVSMDLVNDEVREACNNVFMYGEKVTDKPIKYFYSTKGGFISTGHEKRTYVMTIGYHKFFMD